MNSIASAFPSNSTRWISVWLRNFRVWRKLAIASMFGNLADPMIYLFGLGLGLGVMVGHIDGVPYIAFLAAGAVSSSVMMSASYEGMYSVFARMREQRTWEAIMYSPLTLGDVVLGEAIWGGSKAVLSGAAIMLVAGCLGYASWPQMLLALPVIVLAGLTFASVAMIACSIAPSYDFFLFYQTLLLTPMLMLSGVFFPLEHLPIPIRDLALCLPLSHVVALIRPPMLGHMPADAGLHLLVLCAYLLVGLAASALLFRRRLMR